MRRRYPLFFIFSLVFTLKAVAQVITGVVTDTEFNDPMPGVHIYFVDDKNTLVTTDINGKYTIAARKGKLQFSMVGFETQVIDVKGSQKLNIKMQENVSSLSEVQISVKKKKYSRKNNPAVEMMRKVIAAKKSSDLRQHDYLSYSKYEKMTSALNEVTDKVFEDDHFKHFPFLKEHVEVCPQTGKLILPLTVEEKVSRQIFRKSPKTEKTIIVGQRSEGVTSLVNTGEIVNTMLADCFQDIDIYKDDVRLFQYPFISPISSKNAIGFYRYFITDTLLLDKQKCYQLDFTPNNPQDFGFSGSLYVLADSTWRLKRAILNIPSKSEVNFVEHLDVVQDFEPLPSGEQVVVNNTMLVQLELASWIHKFQVERTVKYSNFDFTLIPEKQFKIKGDVKVEPSSKMRDEDFWEEQRPTPLTVGESQMDLFMKRLEAIKGFKQILWVGKAFVENYIETSIHHPSKVDIGPVNAMISQNKIEGLKLRFSANTTAKLNPHWFLAGYAAYGFKDERWKGKAEVTYCINKREYMPREFPKNNLSLSYYRDVEAPSDKFVPTDKDNVFGSLKWTSVNHMTYVERYKFLYDREWENGVHLQMQFRREKTEAAGDLTLQHMNGTSSPKVIADAIASGHHVNFLHTSDVMLGLEFQPGASWVNTKQRRLKTNFDSPIFGVTHTTGIKGLFGGQYNYNLTEFNIYKRFWLHTWGKIDIKMIASCQWDKVPFLLLPTPAANLSYIRQDYNFYLMKNMEFMTDRNAQLMMSWDLNGKIFNRIPGLKGLKWREYIGCNMMWGYLSDKNNPLLQRNFNDPLLIYFPGYGYAGGYNTISQTMDAARPYTEVIFGIHNIFKLINVECARRINYLQPGTKKWGVRFILRATF